MNLALLPLAALVTGIPRTVAGDPDLPSQLR